MFKLPNFSKVKNPQDKIIPGLVVAVVALAFVMGVMWQKIQDLKGGNYTAAAPNTTTAQTAAQPSTPTVTLDQVKKTFNDSMIKFGKDNSKLVLLEIGDPSCPYCHVAGGLDPELNKQMGGQFTLKADGGTYVAPVAEMHKLVDSGQAAFAYIYTPGHGNGEMGMKALLCANEKGKFWAAHDLIMSNAGYNLQNTTVKNDKTQSQAVADFLKNVVNPNDMKKCLDSGKYDAELPKEVALASGVGVSGTPGFFLNDKLFAGAYNWTDMQSVADAALK